MTTATTPVPVRAGHKGLGQCKGSWDCASWCIRWDDAFGADHAGEEEYAVPQLGSMG